MQTQFPHSISEFNAIYQSTAGALNGNIPEIYNQMWFINFFTFVFYKDFVWWAKLESNDCVTQRQIVCNANTALTWKNSIISMLIVCNLHPNGLLVLTKHVFIYFNPLYFNSSLESYLVLHWTPWECWSWTKFGRILYEKYLR